MYVILGASGKTGGCAAAALIDMGKPVRVVVRSVEKGAVWKARGADVAVADVDDASALAQVLRGGDGAYIIVPRNFAVSDVLESRERCIESLARAADESGAQTGYQIRVPHSSGMLEGKYTTETTFPPGDHRSHRPRSWLVNGVKKIETLRFLERDQRTLGQAAIQWLLAEPRVMTVLPNIYDREQLVEFAKAPDTAGLTGDEMAKIAELAKTNFGVEEAPMKYKGTMSYESLEAPVGV